MTNTTCYYCPYCSLSLRADTSSLEEFSCACGAMVDVLDEDLSMVSLPPHRDVHIVATCELTYKLPSQAIY